MSGLHISKICLQCIYKCKVKSIGELSFCKRFEQKRGEDSVEIVNYHCDREAKVLNPDLQKINKTK